MLTVGDERVRALTFLQLIQRFLQAQVFELFVFILLLFGLFRDPRDARFAEYVGAHDRTFRLIGRTAFFFAHQSILRLVINRIHGCARRLSVIHSHVLM